MLKIYRTTSITVLCLLLGLLGYTSHLMLRTTPSRHLATEILESGDQCLSAARSMPLEYPEFSFSTGSSTSANPTIRCVSNWFHPKSNTSFIEYAGHPNFNSNTGVFLEQQDNDGSGLHKLQLPAVFPASAWKRAQINFPESDSTYRLVLQREANSKAWVALRQSIEFHQRSKLLENIRREITTHPIPLLLQYSLAKLFALILLGLPAKTKFTFGILFLFSVIVHFRFDLFFRDDEWQMLSSFRELGWGTILTPHNEHFIPLHFMSYLLQLKVFGSWYSGYVLISLLVHCMNSFLLYRILQALSGKTINSDLPARLCAFLYAVSAVHTEAIHWVAVQGELFAILAELLCLSLLLKSHSRGKLSAVLSMVCCLAASMFFATGILASVHAIVFCILFLKSVETPILSLALFTVVLVVAVIVYLLTGIHSSPGTTQLFANQDYLYSVMHYLLVAFCIGTVFRGLGLSTSASLDAFHREFSYLANIIPVNTFALVFTIVMFGSVLIYYLRTRDRDSRLSFFLFGVFWISTTLLLPAAGRAMLGEQHAMTLRYHSYSIVGLHILLYPIFADLFSYIQGNLNNRRLKFAAQLLSLACLALFFQRQIHFSSQIKNYWRQGASLGQWYQRGLNFEEVKGEHIEAKLLSYSDRGLRDVPRIEYAVMDNLIRGADKNND